MANTRKFSEFVAGGALGTGDIPVGLEPGSSPTGFVNTQFTFSGGGGGGSGAVVEDVVQANTFSAADIGKAVMIDGAGLYQLALADTAANAEAVGIIISWTDAMHFSVQQVGHVTTLSALVPGDVYWLSDVTPGVLTITEPSTVGHISKPMLIAESASMGWVLSMRGTVIGSGASGGGGGGGGGGSNPLQTTITQPGHGFTGGQWVRLSGTSYVTAQADSGANAQEVGAVVSVIDANNFVLQTSGYFGGPQQLGSITPYVAGTVYYLDPINPGVMLTPEPAIVGQWSRPVFIAATTTTGYILEQRALEIEAPASLSDTSIHAVAQPGHMLAIGDFVRLSGANYITAQGNNLANSHEIGLVIAVADANNFTLQMSGYIASAIGVINGIGGVVAMTPGNVYYLSVSSAGDMQSTAPTAVGNYNKPVFIADSATSGWLLEQKSTSAVLTVPEGGTGALSFTANATIGAGTTSTSPLVAIAPGTAGQVLTSNGALLPPTYQTFGAVGGGLTWIATRTAAAVATVNFDNLLTATYDNYLVVYENVISSTNLSGLLMDVGTGGVPTYSAATYASGTISIDSSGVNSYLGPATSFALTEANGAGSSGLALSNTPARGIGGTLNIANTQSGVSVSISGLGGGGGSQASLGGARNSPILTGGYWNTASAITSIRFKATAGNLTGTFRLYGYQN